MKRLLLITILLGCVAGCSPTSPGNEDVSGTWTGSLPTITNSISLTIAQSGSALSGTWSSQFVPSSLTSDSAGQLSGTKSSAILAITLTPGVPTNCSLTFNATLTNTTTMVGTLATVGCTAPGAFLLSGQLTLTKQ